MRHCRIGKCNTVEPALRATSLQGPLFFNHGGQKIPHIDSLFKTSLQRPPLMATFFGPQGGRYNNFFPCFQNFTMYR